MANPFAIEASIEMDGKSVNATVLKSDKSIEVEMREVPSGTGMSNYESLRNKPSIESVTLIGDKTFEELGLSALSADDLIEILN